MKKIIVIAKNTFKETIRDRILYGIFSFSVLFLLSTVVFGSLSLGEDLFIIKGFGLAGIYIFGMIITIFLGASILYREIEQGSVYLILSKPVRGAHLIVGKFLGLLSSIALIILIMTLIYIIVVWFSGGGFDYLGILAITLQVFESAFFIALLILLSTFSAPIASTIYAILVLYVGHLAYLLYNFAAKTEGLLKYLALAVYYIMPNLEKFNIRNVVIHNVSLSLAEVFTPIFYSGIYIVFFIWIASIIFKKREF